MARPSQEPQEEGELLAAGQEKHVGLPKGEAERR